MRIGIAAVVIAALSFTVQVTQWLGSMRRNRRARHRK
jgi:hypothetical protein